MGIFLVFQHKYLMLEKKFQNIVLLAKRNAAKKSNHIKA